MKTSQIVAQALIFGTLIGSAALIAAGAPALAQETAAPAAKAKKAPTKRKKSAATAKQNSLSRDVVFDGSTIHGKYLSAGEATSTVEKEKKLNDLIGPRADMNDRLKEDRQRLGSR